MGFFKKIFKKKKGGTAVGNLLRKISGKKPPPVTSAKDVAAENKKKADAEIKAYLSSLGGAPADPFKVAAIQSKYAIANNNAVAEEKAIEDNGFFGSIINSATDWLGTKEGQAVQNSGQDYLVKFLNSKLDKPIQDFGQTKVGGAVTEIATNAGISLWTGNAKAWIAKNWLYVVLPGGILAGTLVYLSRRGKKRRR